MTYAAEVLADSPIFYWRLGEVSGTVAVDASGNGNDGTYSDASMHTTGLLIGDADGAAEIVDPAKVVATPVGPSYLTVDYTAFSMEIIVYQTSFGTGAQLFGSSPASPYFYVPPTGPSEFDTASVTVTGPTLNLNQSYHLVATYDGANINYYVNGVLEGTHAATGIQIIGDPGAYWNVGYDGADGTGTYDEAAFYDHALSGARVAVHFAASGIEPITTVGASTIASSASVPPIVLAGPPTGNQFRLSEFLLARLKFTPAQKYRAVPQIQNFVTHITALPAIADITQTPLAVVFDAFDGDEWNMFTMNSDGTARVQVTSDFS